MKNWDTYPGMYSENEVLQSIHLTKNFVLKISIREEDEHGRDKDEGKSMIKGEVIGKEPTLSQKSGSAHGDTSETPALGFGTLAM